MDRPFIRAYMHIQSLRRAHLKQALEDRAQALQGMSNLRGALSSVAPLFEP